MTREVFVIDAVRTPIGRYAGGLATVRPDDLLRKLHSIATSRKTMDPEDDYREPRRHKVPAISKPARLTDGQRKAAKDKRKAARKARKR